MRVILALTLVGLATACGPSKTDQSRPGDEAVYTVSCQGPTGWVAYQTKRHPRDLSNYRSGTWSFLTTKGKSIWASNCIAQID
jgi:hypothetical protein